MSCHRIRRSKNRRWTESGGVAHTTTDQKYSTATEDNSWTCRAPGNVEQSGNQKRHPLYITKCRIVKQQLLYPIKFEEYLPWMVIASSVLLRLLAQLERQDIKSRVVVTKKDKIVKEFAIISHLLSQKGKKSKLVKFSRNNFKVDSFRILSFSPCWTDEMKT